MKFLKLYLHFIISIIVCGWISCSLAEQCASAFDIKIDSQLNEKIYLMLGDKVIVDKKSNARNPIVHIKNYVNMKGLATLADDYYKGLMGTAYEEAAKVYTPEELHQLGWKYFIGNTGEFYHLNKLFVERKNVPSVISDMYQVIRSKYKSTHRYRVYRYQEIIIKYFNGDTIKAFINLFALLDTKLFIRAKWMPVFNHDISYRDRNSKIVYHVNQDLILSWLKNRICNCTFYNVSYIDIFSNGVKWSYDQISNIMFGGDMFRAFVHVVSAFQSHNRGSVVDGETLFNNNFFVWKYPFIGSTRDLQQLVIRIKDKINGDDIGKYQGDEGLTRYADKRFEGDQYKAYVNVYNAMHDNLESFYRLNWPEPQHWPVNVLILLYDNVFTTTLPPVSQSKYTYKTYVVDDSMEIKAEKIYQHYFPKLEYDVNAMRTNFMAYSNEVIDAFKKLSMQQSTSFYRRLFGLL